MNRSRGFTLIELMIVVAVIALLAAIAYPSYQTYVMKGQRSAAQQLMVDIANKQQQYLLDAKQYTTALDSTGLTMVADGWTCTAASCTNARYTVTVAIDNAATPPIFRAKAVPTAVQLSDGYLTYDQNGRKTRTAAAPPDIPTAVPGPDLGW
jgi:type IV pilus assembly protein PilE